MSETRKVNTDANVFELKNTQKPGMIDTKTNVKPRTAEGGTRLNAQLPKFNTNNVASRRPPRIRRANRRFSRRDEEPTSMQSAA